jgi:hypothetical protein
MPLVCPVETQKGNDASSEKKSASFHELVDSLDGIDKIERDDSIFFKTTTYENHPTTFSFQVD